MTSEAKPNLAVCQHVCPALRVHPPLLMHRAHGLDGLRGAAALAVVLVHAWMYSGKNDPGRNDTLHAIISEQRVALMSFFVMSGFLVILPWVRAAIENRPAPSARRYLTKRGARILPAYWIALVGAYFLFRGTGHTREAQLSDLPYFALFSQNYFDQTRALLNPPTWSLAVEVSFYVLIPLFGLLIIAVVRRGGRAAAVGVAVAMMVIGLVFNYVAAINEWPRTVTTSLPAFLPIFACGIAAAALTYGRTFGRRWRTVLFVSGSLLVLWNGWWHHDGTGLMGKVLFDFPAGIGFAFIIVGLVERSPKVLTAGPLRWIGIVSYGFYLWHMPVLFGLRMYDVWPESPWMAYLYVVALSLALAVVSWFSVERWVAGEGKSRTRRRLSAQPSRATA